MNTMDILWLGALGLVVLSLAALLPSLLKESAAPAHSSDAALRALYREQMQELAREHRAGNLSEADLVQAEDELQRRLLAELDQRAKPKSWQKKPWLPQASGLLLAVVLPIASFVLYVQVGDPQAAARLAQTDDMSHGAGAMQVESMVEGLAQRLREQPDNLPGWVMLARSYETMQRYADAASAYKHAIQLAATQGEAPEDQARLWADMADALGSQQDGKLDGAAAQAIQQALLLHPAQAKALALAGAAAVQLENYDAARAHWQTLLSLLEPGSDIALRVQDDLMKLELLLPPGSK